MYTGTFQTADHGVNSSLFGTKEKLLQSRNIKCKTGYQFRTGRLIFSYDNTEGSLWLFILRKTV